ncbi:MAG: Amylo-alpha,6-glucosidase [Pedosphaera sp.]|nr:Amylo-alpha,6-glucosidase [Pedosphaera sp.]
MNSSVQLLVSVSREEAVGHSAVICASPTLAEDSIVLKHNRYFLVTDSMGNVIPSDHCSLGLFHDDTRILSHYALRVRAGPPSLLSAQVLRSYSARIDLAINDAEFGGNSWDPKNCVHILRELVVADRLMERVTLTNHLPITIDYWFELSLGCDFADIFEVRGWKRERFGQFYAPQVSDAMLKFAYRGSDDELRQTIIKFYEPPITLDSNKARWEFSLMPKGHFQAEWEAYVENGETSRPVCTGFRIEEQRKTVGQYYDSWAYECTQYATDMTEFDHVLHRAVEDLRALYIGADDGTIISAGIPWYCAPFGRDTIITSLQTLSLNPRIAINTLKYLARHQGQRENPFTEEEPGKIMHELRRGELARSGETPHTPYYGTIDATPLWLVLLHETWQWTGDDQLVRDLLPHADRALEWIARYGDLDGDNFVEYLGARANKGLVNQGWKDSSDGVPFPDATLPVPPIALVEVQGYVFDAFTRMAQLYAAFGQPQRAENLQEQAQHLREEISRRFWLEELGTFALALDGRKNPLPTISSNAGHLLWSGVPDHHQAAKVAEHLLSPDMFSGWGIRTLSASQHVFNPMSYHNGSVWPHDNSLIVMGLARYGFSRAALPILAGMHDAAAHSKFERLPELFCGMPRAHDLHPVWYPVSCSPQAWASGAFFMLLQAMLGITPEAPARVLHVRNPLLPDFLDTLTISELAIGRSKVSLQFKRYGDRTLANLLSTSGDPVQVRIELD